MDVATELQMRLDLLRGQRDEYEAEIERLVRAVNESAMSETQVVTELVRLRNAAKGEAGWVSDETRLTRLLAGLDLLIGDDE